jgi:thiol-disulfide isomerase/thioredoxin
VSDAPKSNEPPPLNAAEKARVLFRLALFLVLAIVVVVIVLFPQGKPLVVGTAAPEMVARSYNGKSWRLADHYGKPTLVNFWGSWCVPCIREMPMLSKVAKKTRGKVNFLGIAVDSPAEEVSAVVKRFDLQYSIATVDHATQRQWKAEFLPTTYLLDGTGKVVWTAAGATDEKTLKEALKSTVNVTY